MALPDDGVPNSFEDRERGDIHNARHRDGMREGLQVGGLVLIATVISAAILSGPSVLRYVILVAGMVLAVILGDWAKRRIARANRQSDGRGGDEA